MLYEPLPETMVGEYSSRYDGPPAPDSILYNNVTEQSPVIIEICQTRGQKTDLKKVIQLIEEDDYGILEGFVYNYKTQTWLRYRKDDGGQATESAFSEVLRIDLNSLLL